MARTRRVAINLFCVYLCTQVFIGSSVAGYQNWTIQYPTFSFYQEPKPDTFSAQLKYTDRQQLVLILASPGAESGNASNGLTVVHTATFPIASLHDPDGHVIHPTHSRGEDVGSVGSSLGTVRHVIYRFPPTTNALREAWISMKSGAETCWLEVPYGFVSSADAVLTSQLGRDTLPFLPSHQAGNKKTQQYIQWKFVQYELGMVTNDWQLTVRIKNPVDATGEIELYGDGMRWSLDSPKTGVRILHNAGRVVTGQILRGRLDELHRRIDEFAIPRTEVKDRTWAKMVIMIDGSAYYVSIPSSLFAHRHGSAIASRERK